MLLSKSEKKYNLIYIISLIITVISFYINVLNDYKIVIASCLTTMLLLLLNIMRYNTFKRPLKKITAFIYYIFIIWMIANKIYFTFFGDYINLTRIFSAAAPSIIFSAVFSIIKSISLIVLLLSAIVNIITFKKAKFRFKKFKAITIIIFLVYAIITLVFKTYTYEILSCIATSSVQVEIDENTYKPVTSQRENEFEELLSKTHENNSYTGIAKDRNLIMVQCESLQNVFVNRTYNNGSKEYVITPNLNELINNDSLYFNNCFAQIGWGNTSDAEFIVNNSFYPLAMQSIYQRCEGNYYYGLPKILLKNGYSTSVYHGYVADMWNRDKFYPTEGFNKYLSSTSYPTTDYIGFGIADKAFFKQTSKYLKDISSDPFYSFIITLSSHTPFNTSDSMSDIRLSKQDEGSTFGNYIININYLDSAIGEFINELKEEGLYDNSIIVFYGDHHGLNKSDAENYKHMSNFLGKPYQYDDMLNVPLLIHIPGLGNSQTITTTCGQMDIMPTILNLMGIENDTIYFGDDILSLNENSERAIGGGTYMPTGSYIDKDIIFVMSNDSIYEHATIIDRQTGGASDKVVSRDKLNKKSQEIQMNVKLSNTITEKNILEALLNNDTIIMNDVNPQPFIFNLNNDKDEYNYVERLNEAVTKGYNLIAVNVYKDNDEFYVNNKLNLFNKITLVEFLEEVNKYEDTYVILTGIDEFIDDLFRVLGKENPKLATLCIPEIYSFDDYNKVKTFNLNTPILCLDNIDCKVEELLSFIANNNVFAILSSQDNFNANYVNVINKTYGVFVYTKTVNDQGDITYYKNKNVNGFYTDNLDLIKYKNSVIRK